jgi:hypothetical protein
VGGGGGGTGKQNQRADSGGELGSREVTTRTMGASTSLSRYSIPFASVPRWLSPPLNPAKFGGGEARAWRRTGLVTGTRRRVVLYSLRIESSTVLGWVGPMKGPYLLHLRAETAQRVGIVVLR